MKIVPITPISSSSSIREFPFLLLLQSILLETYEGVQFVCENPLDVVIPFTLSLDELKSVICEKIHSERSRRISYPLPVFGGFVHFQTKYVTDEASIASEYRASNRNIELENYNSDSEEDFESNYEIVGPGENEDGADGTMNADVAEVANALANSLPFQEPSFMRSLDLKTMNAPEFSQYMNAELPVVADGEFTVGMEFNSREEVIKAMKDYTIRRGVDYRVYESEPTTFYAKCTQYGKGCDWLIRVTKMQKKYCWEIRRYNGSHTCTRSKISQDHSKLDSKTVAEAKPLVEVDPSLKWSNNGGGVGVGEQRGKEMRVMGTKRESDESKSKGSWEAIKVAFFERNRGRSGVHARHVAACSKSDPPICYPPIIENRSVRFQCLKSVRPILDESPSQLGDMPKSPITLLYTIPNSISKLKISRSTS
ncbi:hypothetical protein Ahy_B09g095044 [Arachis hypogaea]|uniref:Transposase MuDR plant domain-containing protein n=1 Tax=Arachis hypogaea TaxID=3818 RepID=A0A444XCT3_ARAHY|nr:hypothetical protein Ahy_B09g095044 [Arachis hypogaea]